jgi:hypothetical protein
MYKAPEKLPSPTTFKAFAGVVVPIPTKLFPEAICSVGESNV